LEIKDEKGPAYYFFVPSIITATATEECRWNAAYFNATFVANYGDYDRVENFVKNAIRVTNVVVELDSLLKDLARNGKLKNLRQFELIEHYCINYKIQSGNYLQNGDTIYIKFADSIAINKAIKTIWSVDDFVFSPNMPAHAWIFSLHIGLSKSLEKIQTFIDSTEIDYARPDSNLLWLIVAGDIWSSHLFYQYERDGYFHIYTGFYLSKNKVIQAQKLIREKYNLNPVIMSHLIIPDILKKYVTY